MWSAECKFVIHLLNGDNKYYDVKVSKIQK